MKLPSGEFQKSTLKITQQWFGSISQQTIAWANVYRDFCCQMASLDQNELIHSHLNKWPRFYRRHFRIHFLPWILLYFDLNFPEIGAFMIVWGEYLRDMIGLSDKKNVDISNLCFNHTLTLWWTTAISAMDTEDFSFIWDIEECLADITCLRKHCAWWRHQMETFSA